jgi:ferric-dicitrate binding protein FerR (iron transport regulator)
MYKERIAQLIARKLSGEASPEEIKELDALLQEQPGDAYFLSVLAEYWTTPVSSVAGTDEDPEAHFHYILNTAANDAAEKKAVHKYKLPAWLAIAAAFTGLVAVAWWYVSQYHNSSARNLASRVETVAKPGAKSRLLLPDGSIVWLNSGSRISYPATFSDSIREVQLEGEAYFDVAKVADRPFIVRTRDLDIRVLGTAFNVKSYPEESRTEATLIRGLVQVSKKGQGQQPAILLHPHEKVVVSKAVEHIPTKETANPSASDMMVVQLKKNAMDTAVVETAWVYNKLVFDGEDFGEIAGEMERWFNVKISIHDPAVAKFRFHARFENETVAEVLSALQVSEPFTFKINNNEVDIYK